MEDISNKDIKITKETVLKACEIEYGNALQKCLDGFQLALFMYIRGILLERNRIMPKDFLTEELEKIKNEK